MTVDPEITRTNSESTARLEQLATELGNSDRDVPGGWTAAALLAHIAFWDRRRFHFLERYERGGEISIPHNPAPPSSLRWWAVDLINDAQMAEWNTLPIDVAARLAVEAARVSDAKVVALGTEVASKVLTDGRLYLLRAMHRKKHLDEFTAR